MERQREHTSLAESAELHSQNCQLVTNLGAQPISVIPTPFFENRINGRLDWTINNKHSAYFSVSTQANNSLNDQSDGILDADGRKFHKEPPAGCQPDPQLFSSLQHWSTN